jgi:hypothetical protein
MLVVDNLSPNMPEHMRDPVPNLVSRIRPMLARHMDYLEPTVYRMLSQIVCQDTVSCPAVVRGVMKHLKAAPFKNSDAAVSVRTWVTEFRVELAEQNPEGRLVHVFRDKQCRRRGILIQQSIAGIRIGRHRTPTAVSPAVRLADK